MESSPGAELLLSGVPEWVSVSAPTISCQPQPLTCPSLLIQKTVHDRVACSKFTTLQALHAAKHRQFSTLVIVHISNKHFNANLAELNVYFILFSYFFIVMVKMFYDRGVETSG